MQSVLLAIAFLLLYSVVADEGSILRFKEEPPVSLLANVGEKVRLRCKTNKAQEDITWFFNDVQLGSRADPTDSRRQRKKRNKEDRISSFKLMTNRDVADFREHFAHTNIRRRKEKWQKHRGKKDNNLFTSLKSTTRYVRDLSSSPQNTNRFDFQIRSGRLLIQNFTSEAVGWYHCIATTPTGSIRSKSVHLHSPSLGSFEYVGQPVTAQVGQSSVIPCVLPPSEPTAKALWKINETWRNESSEIFTILDSGTLLIKNVTSKMSGYRFRCYAQNPMSKEVKSALSPTILAVSSQGAEIRPKIIFPQTINRKTNATVGDIVSLECVANENSVDLSVRWSRENNSLPATTVTRKGLILENLKTSDCGIYHCSLRGSLVKITYNLTVHEKLKVTPLSAVHVKCDPQNHTETVLRCGTTAESSVVWKWFHNGREVENAKGNVLNITLHGNMSGFYQCFASAGKEVKYSTFQVDGGSQPTESNLGSDATDKYFKGELDKRGIKPPMITSPAHTSNPYSYELSWHIDEPSEIQMKLISIKYCKDPPDSQWKVVNVPSSLDMVVLHGLEPASTYKLEMVAVSQSDTHSMLALSSFSTGEIAKPNPSTRVELRPEKTPKHNYRDRIRIPMAPSKPTVTEISAHSISLMWYPRGNGGSPIKWYRIQRRKTGNNEEWTMIADNLPIANFPPYEITGLPRGSSFKFRVIAVNSKGDSRPSSSSAPYPLRSIVKKPIPSDPPFIMDTKIQGDTSIVLKWRYDFPVSALIGYKVFYRSSDSDDERDYVSEEVRDPTATSYVIHHLRPEMQYDIKIQAFNSEYRSKFSNVVIIEMPKAGEGYHPPITRPKSDETAVYIPVDDHNEPAREKAYHRNTMFLISGGVIAFILIILVISVFFYWRKRNSLSAQSTPDLKLKKIDSNKYSSGKAGNSTRINNSTDSMPIPTNSSNGHTPNLYNQSPHDTRCTCSRHQSNHSSLGRDGGDFSQYTALPYRPDHIHRMYGDGQELGRVNWDPAFTNIQANPLHMYMDHRYPYYPPGLGGLPIRWVRGANGEFCHIVPVDTRKMGGSDIGTELCSGYPGNGSAMVMRTYDGNVGYYDDTAHRPDHGYHSNDDVTKSNDSAKNDKSVKVGSALPPSIQPSDGDSNSEGVATSGVLTHSDTISSRTPSSLSREEGSKIETEDTTCGDAKQLTGNSQCNDELCQGLEITEEVPMCSQSSSREKLNENCESVDENTNFIKSSENITERQPKKTIIS